MKNSKLDQCSIGLDLGGTSVKSGVLLGNIAGREFSAPSILDYASTLDVLADCHAELAQGDLTLPVGLTIPGIFDDDDLIVRDSPNLQFLIDQNPAEDLAAKIGREVVIENDASAAAYAESILGAGREHPSFLFATIGTGIGGGIVLDGELWRGRGMAGEFGHIKVGHQRNCHCGARGCTEAVVSATELIAVARENNIQFDGLPDLAKLARIGDKAAAKVFANAGQRLGEALSQVALILDLRVFLIGGGAAPVLDLLKPTALQVLALQCFGRTAEDFILKKSELGNSAGWMGAALLGLCPHRLGHQSL